MYLHIEGKHQFSFIPQNFHFCSSHFLRLVVCTSEGLLALLAPEMIKKDYSFESRFKATEHHVLTNIWCENVPLCTYLNTF